MSSTLPPLLRFADFEVDLRAGRLRKQGVTIRLQEQPFRVLADHRFTVSDLRTRVGLSQ